MKIFRNKLFTLDSLSIIKDSLDYSFNRNVQGENKIHTKNEKNVIFVALLTSCIINAFSDIHLVKLLILFRISL